MYLMGSEVCVGVFNFSEGLFKVELSFFVDGALRSRSYSSSSELHLDDLFFWVRNAITIHPVLPVVKMPV